ncbi:MAG: type VI secretion system contractile sheath large subunit [Phycisphaeraceae bacterium]|nr:type VI secretion system contractile sheath large subunit [Phycisphaeraceae bacterium]
MSGMRGGMGFDMGFRSSGGGDHRPDDRERPLRVLLLGDFGSGKQSAVAIQPAEIDQAISRLGIELEFEWEGERRNLRVRSIDDFHPDSITEQLPWMSRLIGLRKRIKDPANTVEAIAEAKGLGLLASEAPSDEPPAPQQPDQARTETGGNDLAALLGKPTSAGSKPAAPQGVDIQSFIQKIVGSGPGGSASVGADAADAIRSIDRRLSTMMKAVLRSPRFARVESAWRALHNVLSNAWSEDEVGYEVLSADASRLEQLLSTDLSVIQSTLAGDDAESAGPVDVILLVEPLRATESDLNTVHALSRLVTTVNATLLLSVDAQFVDVPDSRSKPILRDGAARSSNPGGSHGTDSRPRRILRSSLRRYPAGSRGGHTVFGLIRSTDSRSRNSTHTNAGTPRDMPRCAGPGVRGSSSGSLSRGGSRMVMRCNSALPAWSATFRTLRGKTPLEATRCPVRSASSPNELWKRSPMEGSCRSLQ